MHYSVPLVPRENNATKQTPVKRSTVESFLVSYAYHSGGPVVHSTVADWELEEGTDDSEEAHRAAACEGVPAYAGPDSHDVEAFAACQGEAFDAREVPYQVSCLAVGPASSFLAVLADQHAAYSFLDVGLLSGFEVEEQVAF